MVVMGFDPGSIRFGVGVLKKEGSKISRIHSEEIKLVENTFYLKMKSLLKRLDQLFDAYDIDSAAIEEGYLGKNVKSMTLLSQVRGVVLGSLIKRDIELFSYSPRQVKLALTGTGDAKKSQVGKMISILLKLPGSGLGFDEADALAVAYCHLMSNRIKQYDFSNKR